MNLAAPSSSELIRFSVKSNRRLSTLALEPSDDAVDRSVDSALSSWLMAVSMLASVEKFPAAVESDRPEESDETPDIVSVELPSSLNVTFKLAGEPLTRFVPL